MATDIQNEIERAAQEPRAASDDGGSVQAQPIGDMIAADNRIESARVVKKKGRGILFAKLKPPGCQ